MLKGVIHRDGEVAAADVAAPQTPAAAAVAAADVAAPQTAAAAALSRHHSPPLRSRRRVDRLTQRATGRWCSAPMTAEHLGWESVDSTTAAQPSMWTRAAGEELAGKAAAPDPVSSLQGGLPQLVQHHRVDTAGDHPFFVVLHARPILQGLKPQAGKPF